MEQGDKKKTRKRASSIDWREVRERLDTAAGHLRCTMAPEKEKEIMKARAQSLAQDAGRDETDAEFLEILQFQLASECYGIEISRVRETVALKRFTPVPCTPQFVLGLINVRGRIVSVIDLKKFFELPERGLTNLNKVIILHGDGMEFGILADEVNGVCKIPEAELQQSLPTLTGIREEYLKGVTEKRMVVLDGGKLLRDRNIIVREVMESQGSL